MATNFTSALPSAVSLISRPLAKDFTRISSAAAKISLAKAAAAGTERCLLSSTHSVEPPQSSYSDTTYARALVRTCERNLTRFSAPISARNFHSPSLVRSDRPSVFNTSKISVFAFQHPTLSPQVGWKHIAKWNPAPKDSVRHFCSRHHHLSHCKTHSPCENTHLFASDNWPINRMICLIAVAVSKSLHTDSITRSCRESSLFLNVSHHRTAKQMTSFVTCAATSCPSR